jgi:hypothetical protein
MTRPLVFRGVAWYGEDGPGPWDFVAMPPAGFAQYQITGSLRADGHVHPSGLTLDLELVTVKDTETGATVAIRGNAATIDLSGDAAPQYVSRLWRDTRYLAGMARRLGRPPRTTIIANDEQINLVLQQLRRDGRVLTQKNVVANAASFSKENLRYYLRVTGRTWREFLHTS